MENVDWERVVTILYTNYRGETSSREVVPIRQWFGSTEWHPEEQWLLEAYDIGRQAMRSFAMKDIASWTPKTAHKIRG